MYTNKVNKTIKINKITRHFKNKNNGSQFKIKASLDEITKFPDALFLIFLYHKKISFTTINLMVLSRIFSFGMLLRIKAIQIDFCHKTRFVFILVL